MLCARCADVQQRWLDEVVRENPPVGQQQAALQELYRQTEADLTPPSMGFHALLPSDARPLRERASALVEWCQGFLYGFGVSHPGDRELSDGVRVALEDLTQFTHIELQSLRGTDEDEAAYLQISEFVWVEAMLIYHEQTERMGEQR